MKLYFKCCFWVFRGHVQQPTDRRTKNIKTSTHLLFLSNQAAPQWRLQLDKIQIQRQQASLTEYVLAALADLSPMHTVVVESLHDLWRQFCDFRNSSQSVVLCSLMKVDCYRPIASEYRQVHGNRSRKVVFHTLILRPLVPWCPKPSTSQKLIFRLSRPINWENWVLLCLERKESCILGSVVKFVHFVVPIQSLVLEIWMHFICFVLWESPVLCHIKLAKDSVPIFRILVCISQKQQQKCSSRTRN